MKQYTTLYWINHKIFFGKPLICGGVTEVKIHGSLFYFHDFSFDDFSFLLAWLVKPSSRKYKNVSFVFLRTENV